MVHYVVEQHARSDPGLGVDFVEVLQEVGQLLPPFHEIEEDLNEDLAVDPSLGELLLEQVDGRLHFEVLGHLGEVRDGENVVRNYRQQT